MRLKEENLHLKRKDYKGIKTFDELLEREYGKVWTESRNAYEEKAQYSL